MPISESLLNKCFSSAVKVGGERDARNEATVSSNPRTKASWCWRYSGEQSCLPRTKVKINSFLQIGGKAVHISITISANRAIQDEQTVWTRGAKLWSCETHGAGVKTETQAFSECEVQSQRGLRNYLRKNMQSDEKREVFLV